MQNVYARMILYILSPLLAMIPAGMAGVISYDAASNLLSLHVDGAVALLVSALGGGGVVSTLVFRAWGVK